MGRAQRIAFVAPRYSERGTIGGAETLLKALAERCAKAGRQVDFLTTCATNHFTWDNEVPPGVRTVNGVNVHFFRVNEDRDVSTFLNTQRRIDTGATVSRDEELAWITHSVNSRDLIAHLEANKGSYDAILLGPYLFGVTWFGSRVAPEKTFLVPCLHDEVFAYLGIMKDMFRAVRGFLFNTAPERDLAQRLYQVPDGKCSIVGLGLDDFPSDPSAFAKSKGLTSPYIIYSGRRETLKGTPLLCAYMNLFRRRTGRDVKLVFTGSGEIEAPEELRPHILDLGFVSEEEKHAAMAGATVFIHPSVNESLGIVLLEAWLARTPCLVHACGEVLRDQSRRAGGGLWFKYYPEFEEELALLLDNKALRDKLGESGRRFVLDEYSWPAVEKRLLGALDA